jgi:hypothetical protein
LLAAVIEPALTGDGAEITLPGAPVPTSGDSTERTPLSKSEEVQAWLQEIRLAQYFDRFMEEGVDEMDFVLNLEEEDIEMYQAFMLTNEHREAFGTAIKVLKGEELPSAAPVFAEGGGDGANSDGAAADHVAAPIPERAPLSKSEEVHAWLQEIGLAQYFDRFMEEGLDEMDFVLDLEEEDIEMYQAFMLTNEHREAFGTAIKVLKGSFSFDFETQDGSGFEKTINVSTSVSELLMKRGDHLQQALGVTMKHTNGAVTISAKDEVIVQIALSRVRSIAANPSAFLEELQRNKIHVFIVRITTVCFDNYSFDI